MSANNTKDTNFQLITDCVVNWAATNNVENIDAALRAIMLGHPVRFAYDPDTEKFTYTVLSTLK